MKKIIHLSDIHVGSECCANNFRTIAVNIISKMLPAEDYIIVITGDIVENANHPEYIDEAVEIINLLKDKRYSVLVVPGNHDYGNGALGKKKFVGIFKEKYFRNPSVIYPKIDIYDDMAFIGLDSNAEEMHWHDMFFCEGELGKKQLERLNDLLSKPELAEKKKVVYLHHHPFDYKPVMQLKDKDDLKAVIENKIDAILFGHYHNDSESVVKRFHGYWGIPRCYNGGSATHKNGDLGYHMVIDLSNPNPSADYDGCFL